MLKLVLRILDNNKTRVIQSCRDDKFIKFSMVLLLKPSPRKGGREALEST